MLVRILSEWSGSPKCGAIGEVPDALARDRIKSGHAEPVAVPRVVSVPVAPVEIVTAPEPVAPEVAVPAPVERAVKPKGKRR